jgi:hypothetical protein
MVTTKEFGLTLGARSKYRELFHNIVNGMDPVPRLQPSEIVCSLFDTASKALAQTLNMNELPKWFTGGVQTVLEVCLWRGASELCCAPTLLLESKNMRRAPLSRSFKHVCFELMLVLCATCGPIQY